MKLVVESARVADGLALVVASPERGGGRATVRAAQAQTARGSLLNEIKEKRTNVKP